MYSTLFYSNLFYSVLFYSILFCSVLFYSFLIYSNPNEIYSILFCSVLYGTRYPVLRHCSSNVQDQITTILIQVTGNEAGGNGLNWNNDFSRFEKAEQ
jgi:hypothetical protein